MEQDILDVVWFTSRGGCVGIVKVLVGGELHFYISPVAGINEEADMRYIAEWGARFPTPAGVELMGGM